VSRPAPAASKPTLIRPALLPVLRELGTGFVSWSPLGAGFFAGSADRIGAAGEDFRSNHPRFAPENLAAAGIALDPDVLRRIDEVAPVGAAAGAALL
jgi:aryl-alcohol dehydrogenase-like predicted oxidoreductase